MYSRGKESRHFSLRHRVKYACYSISWHNFYFTWFKLKMVIFFDFYLDFLKFLVVKYLCELTRYGAYNFHILWHFLNSPPQSAGQYKNSKIPRIQIVISPLCFHVSRWMPTARWCADSLCRRQAHLLPPSMRVVTCDVETCYMHTCSK